MPQTVQTIQSGYNGHWGHVFQGANTQWLQIFEARIIAGNFFNGLQGQSAHMYDMQIPPGAKIHSAIQRVQGFQNSAVGTMNIPINTLDRGANTAGVQPMLDPFNVYTGWRRDQWTNWVLPVLSTTFTAIAQPAAGNRNGFWLYRQLIAPGGTLANRQIMAQKATTRTGNMTIASASLEMYRNGNPNGSVRLRIQGITTDAQGQTIPDGIDVGVSNDLLLSTLPVGQGNAALQAFTFPGPVTLQPLTDYFWVLEGDPAFVANNVDNIGIGHYNAFLTDGQLYHYGDGLGMDWQNYPGTVDFNQGTQIPVPSGLSDVTWPAPQFITNGFYNSPDLASLVQWQVNQPWYTKDSGIMLIQRTPNSGAINRLWRSAASPNMPRLTVDWRRRAINIT